MGRVFRFLPALMWAALIFALSSQSELPPLPVMFDGVDKLQHQAWVYVDPRLPQQGMGEFHARMRELSRMPAIPMTRFAGKPSFLYAT